MGWEGVWGSMWWETYGVGTLERSLGKYEVGEAWGADRMWGVYEVGEVWGGDFG